MFCYPISLTRLLLYPDLFYLLLTRAPVHREKILLDIFKEVSSQRCNSMNRWILFCFSNVFRSFLEK